ncbi:MAG: hypothetical protein HC873_11820 [Leptolyngbyaceae cyanobacterium SL_1_1]|nr:hypothetical protein [Leptolyngbyaceae cyanobacterium SL_1_1]
MALTTSPRILAFKWRDWCASVNLPYQPQYFPPLAYPSYARGLRSGSRNLLHWARLVQQRPTLSLSPTASGCRCLQAIAQTTPPQLSRLSDLEAHCDTLSARLDQLRHEALKG